jgi:hypothetical protein
MAINFLSSVNLNKNELQKAVVENQLNDAALTSPVKGQIYMDSTLNVLKYYNGSVWVTLSTGTTYTWTMAGNTGTSQTITTGETVSILGGTQISTVASATDTLTINHATITTTPTTSNASPGFGATFTAIDSITTNNGHITALNTKTVTLPANANLNITLSGDVTGSGTTAITTTIGAGTITFAKLDSALVVTSAETIAANNNDTTLPTSAAVKSYVDNLVTGGVIWQGGYDAFTNTPNLDTVPIATTINKGFMWTVTADGSFFGEQVRVGDSLIANQNAPTLLTQWTKVQSNIDVATDTVLGLVKLGAAGTAGGTAAAIGSATARTYSVQFNSNSQLVVNVPWTDTIGRVEQATTVNSGGSGAFLGIDIPNPTAGTVVVGLSINGLADTAADIASIDTMAIYDASTTTNKKVSVANLATATNGLTTAVGSITAGQLTGTVTHSLGINVIVQTIDSTGATVFCDIARAANSTTATISAAQAGAITILVSKIGT